MLAKAGPPHRGFRPIPRAAGPARLRALATRPRRRFKWDLIATLAATAAVWIAGVAIVVALS